MTKTAISQVTFVIVNYKCSDKVARAVESIQAHAELPTQIVVVDNSFDGQEWKRLEQALASYPCELIDAKSNRGFGAGCNLGARHAMGEHLFFLNPDAQLQAGALPQMLATLQTAPDIGAVGCLVVNEGGAFETSHGEFINLRRPLKWGKHVLWSSLRTNADVNSSKEPVHAPVRTDYVTGAALLMRRGDFQTLGGFDETFFMYAEETDLQYRLFKQLGKHVVFDPRARVFHENGGTFTQKIDRRCLLEAGCLMFVRKHHGWAYSAAYKGLTLAAICVEMLCVRRYQEYSLADNWRFLRHMARA